MIGKGNIIMITILSIFISKHGIGYILFLSTTILLNVSSYDEKWRLIPTFKHVIFESLYMPFGNFLKSNVSYFIRFIYI